ncbi:MAG: smalltalk protein [Bacteroides sp.]|nr:smalltalk protein [Bacteroides sp.]
MKKTTWDNILKVIIAIASAVLGAFSANAMNA